MREGDHRLAVQPHQLGVALRVDLREAPVRAEAGVVHEQVDVEAALGGLAGQGGRVAGQVAGDHVRLPGQLGRELLEPLGPASDEDHLVALRRELLRELRADPRRRTRHQRPFAHRRHPSRECYAGYDAPTDDPGGVMDSQTIDAGAFRDRQRNQWNTAATGWQKWNVWLDRAT